MCVNIILAFRIRYYVLHLSKLYYLFNELLKYSIFNGVSENTFGIGYLGHGLHRHQNDSERWLYGKGRISSFTKSTEKTIMVVITQKYHFWQCLYDIMCESRPKDPIPKVFPGIWNTSTFTRAQSSCCINCVLHRLTNIDWEVPRFRTYAPGLCKI